MSLTLVPHDVMARLQTLRSGKQARLDLAMKSARDFYRPMLNADATWNLHLSQEKGRLNLQICTAFYRGDAADVALANKLIRRTPFSIHEGKRFDIFLTSITCQHLADSRHLMDAETAAWCEVAVEEGCTEHIGMSCPDYQFYGYNDNMPAMAVKTLILAGEWFGRQDLIANGLWKLRALAEQLSVFGLIAEYNSPNYTTDTIHNLMTLCRHTRIDEVRELTTKCVRRIWLDLAAHWHPAGRCPAGPFSRAYEHDFCNYLSSLNCMLWVLCGPEVSGISALETMRTRPGMDCMHGNNPLEHTARMVWYATTDDSLLDDATAALFLHKPAEFELIATALQGDAGWLTPFKKTTATSFLSEAYSLGSAAFSFCGGEQTTSLYATGSGVGDISPILGLKYLIDDEVPGRIAEDPWHIYTTGSAEFSSHATAITVQDRASALASYVPHRHYAGKPVSKLRLALIAPTAMGQFGGFCDRKGQALQPDTPYPCGAWYGARLGDALVAFCPLVYTCMDLPAPQIILRRNAYYDYLEIINYSGPARTFTEVELGQLLNGVAMEIANAADWPSHAAFLEAVATASQVDDHFFFRARHLRYTRGPLADRAGTTLMLRYSTAVDGAAARTVSGRLAPEDPWRCTGIPAATLPFMDGEPCIAPPGLPWSDLSMVRFPPETPWAINPITPTPTT